MPSDEINLPEFPMLYESYDGKLRFHDVHGDLYIYGSKAWRLSFAKALIDSTEQGYAVLETEPLVEPDEARYPQAIVILGIDARGREPPKRTTPKGVI